MKAKTIYKSKPKNAKESASRKAKAKKDLEYKLNKAKEEKEKTEEELFNEDLVKVRKSLPNSVLNIELVSDKENLRRSLTNTTSIEYDARVIALIKASIGMRNIRNTVLGKLYKRFINMARTKKYKLLVEENNKLNKQLLSLESKKGKEKLSDEDALTLEELKEAKKTLSGKFDSIKNEYGVTKTFCENYAKELKDTNIAAR